MSMSRLAIATVLSVLTLALAVFGMVGSGVFAGTAGHAGLAASHFGALSGSHVPGLIALGASMAAFILSWGQKSFIISSLLLASGILYTVHLGPLLGDHSAIVIVGPLMGLILGHVILALGVAKGIGSLRPPVAKTAR